MADLSFNNVKFAALSCAVPAHVQSISLDPEDPRFSYHKSFIRQIGISQRHISVTGQTCVDTGYVAALDAMKTAGLKSEDIDGVVFMSQTPDYSSGNCNAFLIHNRLKLRSDAFAFDIPLACSSFNYGLSVCASFLQQPNLHHILMVSGDTQWHFYKSLQDLESDDKFLGGEATTAVILDDTGDTPLNIALHADGSGFKHLFSPNAGVKNKWKHFNFNINVPDPLNHVGPYMDGLEITSFATTTVVDSINAFLDRLGKTKDDFDALVLHQANKQIIKTMGRRLGFAGDMLPMSLDKYANTDGASIPVTISDNFSDDTRENVHLLTSGFGTGLSWGISDFSISPAVINPVIEVEDDRFVDDFVYLR